MPIYYFAYGSNMYTARLTAPTRCPSAVSLGIALVREHVLKFDKVSTDGSGKCDMEQTGDPNDEVWGVIFEIDASEKQALDQAEGLGSGYDEQSVIPITPDGVQFPHPTVAYVATRKNANLQPYYWYKAFVLAGAEDHQLPAAYVADNIRAVAAQQDLDLTRRTNNESLLPPHRRLP
jgi:cation transport regulator ChaC